VVKGVVQGVIFDSGGTIIDTSAWNSDDAYKKYVDILASFGYKTDLPKWKETFNIAQKNVEIRFLGSPMRHQTGVVFLEAAKILGFRMDPAIATHIDYQIQNFLIDLAKTYDDVETHLAEMRKAGLKTALVSNGRMIRTSKMVDLLNLRQYFDSIVVSEEVGYEKYTGIPFKRAMARIGTLPDETIVVGNNLIEDIAGARKAGLRSVHIARKKSLHKDCESSQFKPDYCISKMSELQGVLEDKMKIKT